MGRPPGTEGGSGIPQKTRSNGPLVLEAGHFQLVLDALKRMGYTVVGPTVREDGLVHGELRSAEDLPVGRGDVQDGGTHRLTQRDDGAFFGYAVGQHSWKQFLHPPELSLVRAAREGTGFRAAGCDEAAPRLALVGVRPCDLHAIAIQDRVLTGGEYVDPAYASRRGNAFILAVNCGQASGTCFCASMGTGPRATSGFDLALTEVLEAEKHYFVVDVGTGRGADAIAGAPHRSARDEERRASERAVTGASKQMGRSLDTRDIKALLYRNCEHPRWDDVAARCLTCGNCTMVCPTCFCTDVEDYTDLYGGRAERRRSWHSCFTVDFSHIHGGSIRQSARSRYRQWMTHKLATWLDQFGTSGCVGCGRCITWCPVGIDITEEARAIRETENAKEWCP